MTLRTFLSASLAFSMEEMQRVNPLLDLSETLEKMLKVEKPGEAEAPAPPVEKVPTPAENTQNLKLLMAQMPGGGMPG